MFLISLVLSVKMFLTCSFFPTVKILSHDETKKFEFHFIDFCWRVRTILIFREFFSLVLLKYFSKLENVFFRVFSEEKPTPNLKVISTSITKIFWIVALLLLFLCNWLIVVRFFQSALKIVSIRIGLCMKENLGINLMQEVKRYVHNYST